MNLLVELIEEERHAARIGRALLCMLRRTYQTKVECGKVNEQQAQQLQREHSKDNSRLGGKKDGAREGLVRLHNSSCNLETAHHAHCAPMTALWPKKSTYLLLASKEAPPHVPNHSAVAFFPFALAMIVSIRQVIISTRHLD